MKLTQGLKVPGDAFAFSPDPAGREPWNPDTMTHRYRRYACRLGLMNKPRMRGSRSSQPPTRTGQGSLRYSCLPLMFAQDLRQPGDAGQQSINYWVKRSTAPSTVRSACTDDKVRPEIGAEGLGGHGEGFHFIDVRAGSYLSGRSARARSSLCRTGPWCAPPVNLSAF